MMKLSLISLFATLSLVRAFSVAPKTAITARPFSVAERGTAATVLASTTLDSNEPKSSEPADEQALLKRAEALELEEVRLEMVQKYVAAGKTQEFAEQEVDKFLSDPERSEKYLEMRRYAKAQSEAMMGFESPLFIGGGFLLGLLGTVGLNYLSAMKDVSP